MRTRMWWLAIAPVLAAAWPAARGLEAQTPYRVPDSPAFEWLSASPAAVAHPTTARAFGASLATLVDSAGRFRQGFALEAAPWSWIPGVRIPVDEYDRPGKYMLANTTLSLATAGAGGAAGSGGASGDTELAVGLRTTFFDNADPMRSGDFRAQLRAIQQACGADPDVDPAAVLQCAGERTEQARSRWLAGRWNTSSLAAALVTGWRFAGSRPDSVGWSGWGAWVSGAWGIGSTAQVLGQAGYDRRANPGADDASVLSAGGRFIVGSSWVNGFAEVAVERRLDDAATDPTSAIWSAGVEFRAAPGIWLSTGLGSGFATDASDRMVVIANLRWRITETPQLAPNPAG
jgi:hypothetical protein